MPGTAMLGAAMATRLAAGCHDRVTPATVTLSSLTVPLALTPAGRKSSSSGASTFRPVAVIEHGGGDAPTSWRSRRAARRR